MPKKDFTATSEFLSILHDLGDVLSVFIASPHEWKKRMYGKQWRNYNSYKGSVYKLQRRGVVRFVKKEGRIFLRLTPKGELEVLLAKAKMPGLGKWDGKWRMVSFDIPENAKQHRNKLRKLLKQSNFYQFQKSIYINPYPLNREAIKYLTETGLIKYIRLIKVEEIDDDKDLRKKFGL